MNYQKLLKQLRILVLDRQGEQEQRTLNLIKKVKPLSLKEQKRSLVVKSLPKEKQPNPYLFFTSNKDYIS